MMPQVVYTTLTICVVGPIGASLYFIYGAFHQEISDTLSQLALRSLWETTWNSIGPFIGPSSSKLPWNSVSAGCYVYEIFIYQ